MSVSKGSSDRRGNGPEYASGGRRAILLVERDKDLRRVIAASLSVNEWEVIQAASISKAVHRVLDGGVDLLLIGITAAPEETIQLVRRYRQLDGDDDGGLVLLMTTDRIEDKWRQRLEPDAVVYKPFDMRYLCERVEGLLEHDSQKM